MDARERLDQQVAPARQQRAPLLDFQPFAHLVGQRAPLGVIGKDVAHAVGQIRRQRELAALIGGHFRIFRGRARDIGLILDERFVSQHLAGEHEGVARRQRLDEILLDLSKQPPAAWQGLGGARAHEPHLDHVGLDDGADIHAVALGNHGVGDAPAAVTAAADLGKALIGLQRIAAGGDEIEHGVEIRARKSGIGRGAPHLGIKLIGKERLAAGRAQHVLRQHVERAGARRRRVLRFVGDGAERGAAFQHFETVGRHQHALRRLIHAVIGAADALQQARRAFRRADIDHQIHVAPVDAEIERGGAHHRAQPACGHGLFHFAALRHIEGAVMQGDREPILVDVPQLLENALGLAAGVDEDERRLVTLDQVVDLAERMMGGMAGPRQMLGGVEHADFGLRAVIGDHQVGERFALLRLRHQKAAQVGRCRHRGR